MLGAAGIRFSRAMIMVRGAEGVAQSVNFYQNALGMDIVRHTDDWAELVCGIATKSDTGSNSSSISTNSENAGAYSEPSSQILNDTAKFRLSIKAVGSEAQICTGYSPFLTFDVSDMDSIIARCAQLGAHLDGPIQYPAHGKIATMRAPDGHMIGLYEPAI